MADSQFCLEWDAHNKNICKGLSSLQQSGEFVDMTLAADGHHVRVHQMVMALASPYIKELISSASCPHPVIFLNKVSYKTLCSILEYIYTGRALVGMNDIGDLITAAKELHIKGLEDVKAADDTPLATAVYAGADTQPTEMPEIQIKLHRQVTTTPQTSVLSSLKRKPHSSSVKPLTSMPIRKRATMLNTPDKQSKDMPVLLLEGPQKEKEFGYEDELGDRDDYNDDDDDDDGDNDRKAANKTSTPSDSPHTTVQYTVSNQGSLQLVMNRFVYSLYYQYRDKSRQWRCVDTRKRKCMASVFTKDNIVLRRVGAHNHPFHDKNILKKVHAGRVYSALHEAEARSTRGARNLRKDKDPQEPAE